MIKKLNLKTKLIIFMAIVSIISVIYIVSSQDKTPNKIDKQFINPPELSNYFENELTINHSLNEKDFTNFPKTLPYLKQSPLTPFTKIEMENIASNFGFKISPIEIDDTMDGKFYVWNSDKYSLIIHSQIRKIEITPSFNPTGLIRSSFNKQISDEGYKNLAINLIFEKLNINRDFLKFSGLMYLKTEEGLENYRITTKEGAEITQVNLYTSDGSLPIYSVIPYDSQIYVQFTKDGELLNLKASLFSEYKMSDIEYNIKTFTEVVDTINESVLVSLNDSNINIPDLIPTDIKNINIEKLSLVYLQESFTTEILQPVFLLEGSALISEYNSEVTALFYLPAYSKK